MMNNKFALKAALASGLVAFAGFAHATAPNMGNLINDNIDIGSISTVATSIIGSAITVAGLVSAARVGRRLINAL